MSNHDDPVTPGGGNGRDNLHDGWSLDPGREPHPGAQGTGAPNGDGGYDPFAGLDGRGGGTYGEYPGGAYGAPGAQHGPPGEGVRQPGGDEAPEVPVATYASGLRIGDAFSFGFRAFGRAPLPWIGAMFLVGIITLVLTIVLGGVLGLGMGDVDIESGAGTEAASFSLFLPAAPDVLSVVVTILIAIVTSLITALFIRGALEQVDGRSLGFGDFFRVNNWGTIALGAILSVVIGWFIQVPSMLGAMSGSTTSFLVGSVVTLVIAIAAGPFYGLLLEFIVDRRLSPIDALKANIAIAKRNWLKIFLLDLVAGIVVFVGFLLFFVGALAAAPIAFLMTVHGYRQLTEGRRPIEKIA